jgi:hypothetical protein
MTKTRIVFHPFFLVRLIHLMRRRHVQEAIDLAGREIRIALDDEEDETGDEGESGEIVIVPAPKRAREIYSEATSDDPNQPKGPKL